MTTQTWPSFLKDTAIFMVNPFDWRAPAIPGTDRSIPSPGIADVLRAPVTLINPTPDLLADRTLKTMQNGISAATVLGAAGVAVALLLLVRKK